MDSAAILRVWSVEVTVGDLTFEIPALPAADWILAMADRDALSVVPGLLNPEDEAQLDDALAFGEVSLEDVRTASRDAVEAASGRPWWEAYRLVLMATENADQVLGTMLARGMNLDSMSLGAFCVAAYALATAHMDKKDKLKFDTSVKTPPIEEVADDEEALSSAFMQAMNERPGR